MLGLPNRKQEDLTSLINLVAGKSSQSNDNEFQSMADGFTARTQNQLKLGQPQSHRDHYEDIGHAAP